MIRSPSRRPLFIRQGAALLAVFALFLAFLGPALDHHFAERQIGHGHLSIGHSLTGHQHFYQGPGNHTHFGASGPEAAGPDAAKVVYLTSNYGSGTPSTVLNGPETNGEFVIPDPGGGPLLAGYSGSEIHHLGLPVPPLERPPRA